MTKKTTTEAELREWVAQGMTHQQIAERIGHGRTAVAFACSVLGITRGGFWKKDLPVDDYTAKVRAGFTLKEIGAAHGVSQQSVLYALKSRGLPTTAREILRREFEQQQAT